MELKKANNFINENQDKIDKKFYPKINFAAPIGWINDPNGVSYYKGYYHLFYQYYPYDAVHGPMHWGHARSKNGLAWENLPVALAPDHDYDQSGVFSGSAYIKDDRYYLFFTGHIEKVGYRRENQNMASSDDGIYFDKSNLNPLLDEKDLPCNISVEDFRDPKVFAHDGHYYMVVGTKTMDKVGTILLFTSPNLYEWKYKSILISDENYLGEMAECPDLLLFEDRAVLLVSAMEYKVDGAVFPHKTLMIEGDMDWVEFKFKPRKIKEMDLGFDYYAPQTCLENDGSYFAIAWQQSWGKSLIPSELGHKWVGQMTIPQRIYLEDGKIKRSIHPKVLEEKKIQDEFTNISNKIEIKNYDLISIKAEKLEGLSLNFLNEKESISLDFKNGIGMIDRSNVNYPILNEDGSDFSCKTFKIDTSKETKLDIIFDRSSIQVYINKKESISLLYYSEDVINKTQICGKISYIGTYLL